MASGSSKGGSGSKIKRGTKASKRKMSYKPISRSDAGTPF